MRPTHCKDDAGRAILFLDFSRIPTDGSYDRHSMSRAFWYYMHAVLEDEDVQKKGCVIIAHPRHAQRVQFDRKLGKLQISSLRGCIPVRAAAFHICHSPFFFEVLFSVMKVFLGERLRKRVKFHSGEDEGVLQKMEHKYGITRDKLPIEMGGELKMDHMGWLEQRKKAGI